MKMLPKYRATFFTRLIISFTVLTVILLGTVGGYLYSQANRLMTDEITRESQFRLVAAMDYVEQSLLRIIEDKLEKKALSTTILQSNSDINFLLSRGWEGSASRILAVVNDLELLKKSTEGAFQITAYFEARNFVVDNNRFYMLTENSGEAAFIMGLEQTITNKWMRRTLSTGEDVLTYVVKLPYTSKISLPRGYLIVDVEVDYIDQAMAQIISSPLERFYIFDSSGELLINSTDVKSDDIQLLKSAISSKETFKKIADENYNKLILSHLDGSLSKNGWLYAMVRPNDSFILSSEQFKTKIFITCSLVLLLGILISYIISKRFYIPMRKLLQLVQPIRNHDLSNLGNSHSNEYTIISNSLKFMGQKIINLESLAEKNNMKNLVLGASLESEIMDRLPQECSYMVARIQIVHGKYQVFKQRFGSGNQTDLCEFVVMNPQELAIIYFISSTSEAEEERIVAYLRWMQQVFRDEIRFGVAIGLTAQTTQGIPLSYQAAEQASRYHFLYGPEAIVLHSEISTFSSMPEIFSFDSYINVLKAGNVDGANRFIDEFNGVLKKQKLKLEVVELALLQLYSTLYQIVIDLKIEKLVPTSSVFDEFKKATLTETIRVIRDLSERIAIHVRDSGSHAHAEVIFKLKTYIDEHLQEDLSLNVLSDVALLAPTYISTLFGEVMGQSFTEYVTKARLDKAGHLLCEEPHLTASEIAYKVGYRNPQYFHNKFKARFGVTPGQYRNVNCRELVEN